MAALKINLPDDLKAVAESRAAECGRSLDAYLSALIRADAERDLEPDVEKQLIAGLDSGPATELAPNFWQDIKLRVRKTNPPPSS